MSEIKILWADDEIELLKPQLFFLEKKGYRVETVTNGHDALDVLDADKNIDVIFLDESMPGLSGLDTLAEIRSKNINTPVVMITKNEAENLMEEAIGAQINDYLIKPVNPNQILLSLKKIIDNKRLVSEKTALDYQSEFRNISMEINSGPDYDAWVNIYKKIISWELKLDSSNNAELKDILDMQKSEANKEFSKYIIKNYENWIMNENGPLTSQNLIKKKVLPHLKNDTPAVFVLLDNLRMDQWKVIEPMVTELFEKEEEDYFYSILPTTTQYSRNAIFAGLLPASIQKRFRDKWVNDADEGGKNLHEQEFLEDQITRLVRRPLKVDYHKVTSAYTAKIMSDNILNAADNDLTAIVYNFIDMLSHSRTEMEVLKELASDEKAYRSLTDSWFRNSPLWDALKKIADKKVQLFITTDHGTIRVQTPSKVVGDKDTTTNLRYKLGKNLQYNEKDVLEIRNPEDVGLPSPNISSRYIFGKEDTFFLYPNNYTYYNNFYRDTFQHGGISLEEMICPIIRLSSKR